MRKWAWSESRCLIIGVWICKFIHEYVTKASSGETNLKPSKRMERNHRSLLGTGPIWTDLWFMRQVLLLRRKPDLIRFEHVYALWSSYFRPTLKRIVLGCIDADFVSTRSSADKEEIYQIHVVVPGCMVDLVGVICSAVGDSAASSPVSKVRDIFIPSSEIRR